MKSLYLVDNKTIAHDRKKREKKKEKEKKRDLGFGHEQYSLPLWPLKSQYHEN